MSKSALIVVDMQNDFMSGGTLEVAGSADIITPINTLIKSFDIVVATKDWHPKDHLSFASQWPVAPFTEVLGQMRWPDHCVAGTWGSEFHKDLDTRNIRAVFHKGVHRDIESYSGFEDNNGNNSGLGNFLMGGHNVEKVFVCGLALDYCVKTTAEDSNDWFETFIIQDATKSVDKDFKFIEHDGIKLVSIEQALSEAK